MFAFLSEYSKQLRRIRGFMVDPVYTYRHSYVRTYYAPCISTDRCCPDKGSNKSKSSEIHILGCTNAQDQHLSCELCWFFTQNRLRIDQNDVEGIHKFLETISLLQACSGEYLQNTKPTGTPDTKFSYLPGLSVILALAVAQNPYFQKRSCKKQVQTVLHVQFGFILIRQSKHAWHEQNTKTENVRIFNKNQTSYDTQTNINKKTNCIVQSKMYLFLWLRWQLRSQSSTRFSLCPVSRVLRSRVVPFRA